MRFSRSVATETPPTTKGTRGILVALDPVFVEVAPSPDAARARARRADLEDWSAPERAENAFRAARGGRGDGTRVPTGAQARRGRHRAVRSDGERRQKESGTRRTRGRTWLWSEEGKSPAVGVGKQRRQFSNIFRGASVRSSQVASGVSAPLTRTNARIGAKDRGESRSSVMDRPSRRGASKADKAAAAASQLKSLREKGTKRLDTVEDLEDKRCVHLGTHRGTRFASPMPRMRSRERARRGPEVASIEADRSIARAANAAPSAKTPLLGGANSRGAKDRERTSDLTPPDPFSATHRR